MGIIDILAKLFPNIFNGPTTRYWLKNAPIEELEEEREKLRKAALLGDRNAERQMFGLDNVIITRRNEEYRKNHPNSKPVHKEHGWYLSKDDCFFRIIGRSIGNNRPPNIIVLFTASTARPSIPGWSGQRRTCPRLRCCAGTFWRRRPRPRYRGWRSAWLPCRKRSP